MKAQIKPRPQSKKLRTQSSIRSKRLIKGQTDVDLFKMGKSQQSNQSYHKAIDYYMKATISNPSYYQAFSNMGYCYKAIGQHTRAKKAYMNALYISPEDVITHYNLANLYRVLGQNEHAIKEYQFVIMLKEGKNVNVGDLYLNSLINIAICYKNLALLQEAIAVNQRALKIDPNEESVIFNLAMCILGSIQSKNSSSFNKSCQERTLRAKQLFQKSLQINPKNNMTKLSLIKISNILDKKEENLNNSITLLKKLLEVPNNHIQSQINQYIGYCLNLLKKFKESSQFYHNSVGEKARRTSKLDNISNKSASRPPAANLFAPFADEKENQNPVTQKQWLNESEGIRLISIGNHKQLLSQLKNIPEDNLMKNTLLMIMYMTIAQQDNNQEYFKKANSIYRRYFEQIKPENYQKISIEGHSIIANILSCQNKYQESVQHYEYISKNINDDRENSAKVHSSLADGFQNVGNISRAIEQYKKAIEIEPDNVSLSYSIGYCLYENGKYEQATQYFSNILNRLEVYLIDDDTKQLYEVDCKIILAMASIDNDNQDRRNQLFQSAFAKLDQLKQTKNQLLEMEQSNLMHFFDKLAEIYESQLDTISHDSPDRHKITTKLLKTYTYLLQFSACLDRDQILANCANLYYELGQYCAVIQSLDQIKNINKSQHFLNKALAYCHLIEPALARIYIEKALMQAKLQKSSVITIVFIKEIILWMNSNENSDIWKLPSVKYDMFYERYEFGVAIIDKFTEIINSEQDKDDEQLKIIMANLIYSYQKIKFNNPIKNAKFSKLKEFIKSYAFIANSPIKNIVSDDILKICFSISSNIRLDFSRLLNKLKQLPSCGMEAEYSEALLFIFIYYNASSSQCQTLINQMKNFIKGNVQGHEICLDNLVDSNEESYSIIPNFANIRQLISLLRQWQTILQPKISKIVKLVEQIYYKGNTLKPIETEYHFPRHANLLQCDETFQKFIYFALKVIKFDSNKIRCKNGQNIQIMKRELIKEFQNKFNSQTKHLNVKSISLTTEFLPVTLYISHKSKQQTQSFINEIIQRGSSQSTIVIKECDEVVIIFNRLVRLRCKWSDPFSPQTVLKQVVSNIIEDPLFIGNQAIIYLLNLLAVVRDDSVTAAGYIKTDKTLI